ncbi:BZIP transcription factor [Daldinia childiae]|uniref:BZIP transcription factor n=1 Tax=Daldinia childiae TaxID=326645 RepID=UPI001444C47D|nr:BZIP transcription factor [Daldinia childiae]KAF3070991.1 BZIP transcription factor [Daldinia childiae]
MPSTITGSSKSTFHPDLGAGEQLKLDFLLDPSHRVNRMQTGVNGAQDTPGYQHLPTKHDWNVGLLPPPRNHAIVNSGPHQHQQHRIEYAPRNVFQPVESSWVGNSAPIKNGPSTCPLDSLLLEFLQERRQRAAEGVPTRDIIGPRYPSVSSLLNPANSVFSHPLSKVFTDILAAFPGMSGLPERVAVLYYMFLVMRWQVSPTQENYDLLPPFALPTPAQLQIAHPAWIDHLPFPHMREKLAKEYNPVEFLFDNFFIPFTTTISLNWPYEATDTLLQSPDGNELLINPVFERHLRRFENWTLGESFDKAFPRLRGTYNLKRCTSAPGDMADGQFSGG